MSVFGKRDDDDDDDDVRGTARFDVDDATSAWVLCRFFLWRSANFHMRRSSITLLMHVFSDLTLSCRCG